jgi:hypothetical protein
MCEINNKAKKGWSKRTAFGQHPAQDRNLPRE